VKDILRQLSRYLVLLSTKWVLWVSGAIGIIGTIIYLAFPQVTIPYIVYLVLAFVGFLWANFQVFRENLSQVVQHQNELDVLRGKSEVLPEVMPEIKPELLIELVEGNAYTYYLGQSATERILSQEKVEYIQERDRLILENNNDNNDEIGDLTESIESIEKKLNSARNTDLRPNSALVMHLRIYNTGTVGLDLISIELSVSDSATSDPWIFSVAKPNYPDGKEYTFPIRLDPERIILCDLYGDIRLRSYYNNAQIAARLAKINPMENNCLTAEVVVEVAYSRGQTDEFYHVSELSTRPLKDLYITLWQEKNQTDLLRLANAAEPPPLLEEGKTEKSLQLLQEDKTDKIPQPQDMPTSD
jgi:hypothetical protein